MVDVDLLLLELPATHKVHSVDAVLLQVGVEVPQLIVFRQTVVRTDVLLLQQPHQSLQPLVENQSLARLEEETVEAHKLWTVHVVLQMVIQFVEIGLKVAAAPSTDSVVIPQDIVVLAVKVDHVLAHQFNKLQDHLQLLQIQIQVLSELLVKLVSPPCTPVFCQTVVSSFSIKLRTILKSS